MSLMEHVRALARALEAYSTAGAATGTALNVGDPTLWPRWLLMFGLALGTTAVWVLVDVVFLSTGKRPLTEAPTSSRAWGFARKLYTRRHDLGRGGGHVVRLPRLVGRVCVHTMFGWPLIVLTVATAVAPGPALALMMTTDCVRNERATVAAIALLSIWRARHQRP